jgi:hypothetical protein
MFPQETESGTLQPNRVKFLVLSNRHLPLLQRLDRGFPVLKSSKTNGRNAAIYVN